MSGELPSDVNPYQIEPQLSAYAPRPARIDRDRLMFEAGHAAAASHPAASAALALRPGVIAWFPAPQPAAPTTWVWPASTVAMAVVAAGLGLALLVRPAPLDRVHVVRIPTPVARSVPEPLAVSSGGLNQPGHDFVPQPVAEQKANAPVMALESLPEEHPLRLRQVVLTEGVDALAPPVSRETARFARPPTRGSLMRSLASPSAASTTRSAPLFGWPDWFTQRP